MLKRRSELPHFWFYDTLFKPFNTLMGLEMCDDEIQDQVRVFLSKGCLQGGIVYPLCALQRLMTSLDRHLFDNLKINFS